MTTETIVRDEPRDKTLFTPPVGYWDFPTLCWRAIIGGTVAAAGIHILLTLLGMAAGLAAFSPATDADPVTHFNKGAAVVWSVGALVSLWFGGLIAGRYSRSWHTGFVHGILVWSLSLIIVVLLLAAGSSVILGGGLKILGKGLGAGTTAVASAAGGLAGQDAGKRYGDELNSFVDEATQSAPTNGAPSDMIREKRGVGLAVAKLFAPGNEGNLQDNRKSTIQFLVDNAHMSEADATKMVDGWITSYNDLKSELEQAKTAAEQKARTAAQAVAHDVSTASTWLFVALLLGLIVTALGGVCGAHATARAQARLTRVKTQI